MPWPLLVLSISLHSIRLCTLLTDLSPMKAPWHCHVPAYLVLFLGECTVMSSACSSDDGPLAPHQSDHIVTALMNHLNSNTQIGSCARGRHCNGRPCTVCRSTTNCGTGEIAQEDVNCEAVSVVRVTGCTRVMIRIGDWGTWGVQSNKLYVFSHDSFMSARCCEVQVGETCRII